jgi:very-short-patch-repair endonuclease
MMAKFGAKSIADTEVAPESICEQVVNSIKEAVNWYESDWKDQETNFEKIGFRFDKLVRQKEPEPLKHGELIWLEKVVTKKMPDAIDARINYIEYEMIENRLNGLSEDIEQYIIGQASSIVLLQLRSSIIKREKSKYRKAFKRVMYLLNMSSTINRRNFLLERLDKKASGWAKSIRDRTPPHHTDKLPGDARAAWLWRQLHDGLRERYSSDINQLQREISKKNHELQNRTIALVDRLAWAVQVSRTTLEQRKALIGWVQTIRKIGAGTGKRVPQLRLQARQQMNVCRSAIPVWIMPISRVLESFNPAASPFDVVIIDEASQSDVMALVNLYLAREAIIVGDQEQVSPVAVGQELSKTQILIEENLYGIPNKELYDGRTSIYDLGMQSFEGYVPLLEHFRCVPEIIQFSNMLSYNGKIRPLRDASKVITKPYVIGCYTIGIRSDSGINEDEALAIASLIVSLTENPLYDGKTMGVISLVGEEQAARVESLLRENLSPVQFEKRRIICGNAAQFQGDERDVIFLSVVDDARDRRLPLRSDDMFRKRYNVSASRAKDQMWIMYSLNPTQDLKPSDLRRKLIEYAINTERFMPEIDDADKSISDLEYKVRDMLVDRGYKVTPKWKVGYFVIDMVVEGNGLKLAVACEGGEGGPTLNRKRIQQKLDRQAVLERLGWEFIRIRGSEFFREKEKTMRVVFDKLRELHITHDGNIRTTPNSENKLIINLLKRASEIRMNWGYPHVIVQPESSDWDITIEQESELHLKELTKKTIPDRQIDEITVDEIRKVIIDCIPSSGEIEHSHLLLSSAHLLGYRDLFDELEKRLNRVIDSERLAGRLETITGVQKHRRVTS